MCSSHDWILSSAARPRVVRCRACGLAYVNPRPTSAQIGKYYPADYAPYRHRDEKSRQRGVRGAMLRWAGGAPAVRPNAMACAAMRLLSLVRRPETFGFGVPYQGQGRLLDFGCGGGEFLRRMQSLGWSVTGVDFSQEAVDRVRSVGIEAHQGSLPNALLAGRRFDVITMRMSLEHVFEPVAVVKAAAELLEVGGKLVIIVPNFAAWDRTHFQEAWFSLDMPRHLLHFDPSSMRKLMEKAGLQVQTMRPTADDGILRKSLALQVQREGNGAPGRGWGDRLLRIKPIRKCFGSYLTRRGWGNDLLAVGVKTA